MEHDLRIRFDYGRAVPWTRRVDIDGTGTCGQLSIAGPRRPAPDRADAAPQDSPASSRSRTPPRSGPSRRPGAAGDLDEDEGAVARSARRALRALGRGVPRLGADLARVPRRAAHPRGPRRRPRPRGGLLGTSGPPGGNSQAPRAGRPALAARAAGAHRPRDRRDRRGPHHLPARGVRRGPQLGLPLHVAPGRGTDHRGLVAHDFTDGALHWRNWLLRAVAGDPDRGPDHVRAWRGTPAAREPSWATSAATRARLRCGSATAPWASFRSDVVGEVMLALASLRDAGMQEDRVVLGTAEEPAALLSRTTSTGTGHGIWEMRGDPAYFVHGRAMMWAAFDQGVRAVEGHGLRAGGAVA